MKVLLLYPNQMSLPKCFDKITTIQKQSEFLPPLGMLYIKSNSKFNPDFLDNRIEKYTEDYLLTKIIPKYDIICFGGSITEVVEAKSLSSKIKKLFPNIITIYGGPNATVESLKYKKHFDIIVKGEGEFALDKVLENITKHKGKIVESYEYMNKEELDSLKYPAREDVDMTKYRRNLEPDIKGIVDTIVSSRGCPFNCTFCSSKYLWQQKWRTRSNKSIIDEIKYLQNNFGTKGIYFREDNFTVNKNRTISLCKELEKLNIEWSCESRVNTLDNEVLLAMANSGCKIIWFGIESTNNETLKKIKKYITIEMARDTIKRCKQFGIKTGAGFIIGFPHETLKEMKQTIKECRNLGLDKIYINRFIGIPISEDYLTLKKLKLNKYEFEGLTIPSTQHVDSDIITDLVYKSVLTPLQRLTYSLPLGFKDFFKTNFTTLFYWINRRVYK